MKKGPSRAADTMREWQTKPPQSAAAIHAAKKNTSSNGANIRVHRWKKDCATPRKTMTSLLFVPVFPTLGLAERGCQQLGVILP